MFCREVGTTIIRGIFDKNKAETPSKKRFLGGGTGRGQDARAASVHWGGVAAGRGGGGGLSGVRGGNNAGGGGAGGKQILRYAQNDREGRAGSVWRE